MTESYQSKMMRGKTRSGKNYIQYVREVVAQPTQQSNVKAKLDKTSPTGISQDKKRD